MSGISSRLYQGSIISASATAPTGPYQCGLAPGVWTIDQVSYWQKAGLWPTAGNVFPTETLAIFALGGSNCYTPSSVRNKYIYSGCVSSTATSASVATSRLTAVGTSTVGIFSLGCNGTVGLASRNKLLYPSCSNSYAASASASSAGGSAAGNSTVGIFALGHVCSIGAPATTRNKYTYSGDVNSSATASSQAVYLGSSTGNSTVGIFALAYNTSYVRTNTRDKYTYSNCTSTSATSATTANSNGSAVGNSTVGIFALGATNAGCSGTTTRNKYTYSGDTNTAATSSTVPSYGGSAAGNSTTGIFAIGYALGSPCSTLWTQRNKYTYSGCVSSAATNSSAGSIYGAGASNGTSGVNM